MTFTACIGSGNAAFGTYRFFLRTSAFISLLLTHIRMTMHVSDFRFQNTLPSSRAGRSATICRIGSLSLVVLFMLGAFGLHESANAQNARIHHQIIKSHESPPTMGREFWFAMTSNYWGLDNGGKYMRIYITSPQNTTAYVSIGVSGAKTPVPILAYKVGTFKIPESWEMESSGVVEPKAIHVWSNDADLTVYDMSHNAYTSDGSYIIPTIGWGNDYVVAAYASLYELTWDDPSEFTVTASIDHTVIDITPSCDFRQCPGGNESGDGCSHDVGYPAGHTFSITLNRGECAQFKPVLAQGADGYDVTGTIIHANNPVGVVGGSDCPNIPADFPYCDHVEDMIPPVRTWATTYYTTNFVQPPTMPGHDFGLYLMVASKPGQTIWREDASSGAHVECQLSNKYDNYWDELELAQKFWSDAPFLLVEYMNSSTYPDHDNGQGDPAEVVINPREQYSKDVVFQTPVSVGAQAPYDSYANIIVNLKDERQTTFDGQKILSYTHQPIDDTFEVFNITHIAPGVHTVTGDTLGVGVYIYGYGYDESYAWAGNMGTKTFNSQDTVSPLADTSGSCYDAFVHLSDSGINPGGIPQSMLNMVRLDSDYNMVYIPDPSFHEGVGLDTSSYSMYVLDRTKPAYLKVEAYDVAGNETMVISTYTPQVADIEPPLQNFGSAVSPTTKYEYDTIINTGQVAFNFDKLTLLYGNLGFTIDSGMIPSVLAVGERRVLKISFQAVKANTVVDSILFGDECGIQSVALTGTGGQPDFQVTDQHWPNEAVPPGPNGYVKTVTIENLSSIPINIDTAWWADQVHFKPVDKFPVTVDSQGTKTFRIAYYPDNNSLTTTDRTQGFWRSSTLDSAGDSRKGVRNDSLTGNGVAPTEYFIQDVNDTILCAQPGDTEHLTFQIADTGTSAGTITRIFHTDSTDFKNLQGVLSSGGIWNPAITAQTFAPGESATITLDYPEPVGTNVTAVDSLFAINSEGDTVMGHPIVVTIHLIYKEGQVQPQTVYLPATRYQQAGRAMNSFIISNSTSAPLDVSTVTLTPGGNYNNSYSFTTNPALPATLAPAGSPGDKMTVTIAFNDSLSFDSLQAASFEINSGSCSPMQVDAIAPVRVSGAAWQSYTAPPVLACEEPINDVKITNTQPGNGNETIVDTIESATWVGPNGGGNHGANFSIPNILGDTLESGQTLPVPVTFIPGSGTGLVTYNDTLAVTLHSSRSDTTIYIPVSNTAGTALATGYSEFATPTAAASDQVSVPATVSINKLGLPILIDSVGITGIKLTYSIPHPDLLIPNKPNPFTISNPLKAIGWSATTLPNANGVRADSEITVMLSGSTPLPDGLDSAVYGQLNFQVALDKADDETAVTLDSLQLFTGVGATTPLGSCVATVTQSSDFSLVLRCGDSTLKSVMLSGAVPVYIKPATPDPVTGSSMTFEYATRGEANITLAIYDVLGHEVATPVDNVPQDAGTWQVRYDASKLPNGTYTYRLSTEQPLLGGTAVSRQFVVQR